MPHSEIPLKAHPISPELARRMDELFRSGEVFRTAYGPPGDVGVMEAARKAVSESLDTVADEVERRGKVEALCRELVATLSIPKNREAMATAWGLAEFFRLFDERFVKRLEALKPGS